MYTLLNITILLGSELRKYMDPNFLDDQAVANAAKIKIILSRKFLYCDIVWTTDNKWLYKIVSAGYSPLRQHELSP